MTVDPVPVDIFDTDSSVTNWTCKVCRSPFSEEDLIRKHVILEHLQDYYKVNNSQHWVTKIKGL